MAIIATDGEQPGGRQLVTGTYDVVTGFTADATHTNCYSKAVANCIRLRDLAAVDRLGTASSSSRCPPLSCATPPRTPGRSSPALSTSPPRRAAPTDSNTRYFQNSPHL
ncbi:hypothetical protein ACI78R_18180 [Geodermatophilus sp. SYSU D01106]